MSVTVSPQEKVVGLTLRVMSGEALVTGVGVGAEVRVALTPSGVLKALIVREEGEMGGLKLAAREVMKLL